ncbi:MAG: hypothetical protein ACOZQL_32025 [Myxococcota bacterium]
MSQPRAATLVRRLLVPVVMFRSIALLSLSACTIAPATECRPVAPTTYAYMRSDAGVSEFVVAGVITTTAENGSFPREPKCVFTRDGGAAAIGFDQLFCRSVPLDAFGEEIRFVNVPCVAPPGTWRLTGSDGRVLVVERTDAGHVCTAE